MGKRPEKKSSVQYCHRAIIQRRLLAVSLSHLQVLSFEAAFLPFSSRSTPLQLQRGGKKRKKENLTLSNSVKRRELVGSWVRDMNPEVRFKNQSEKKAQKVMGSTFHKVSDIRSSAVWSCWCPTGWGRTAALERPRTTCRPPGWAATRCNWRRRPQRTFWLASPLHLEAAGKCSRDYRRTAG